MNSNKEWKKHRKFFQVAITNIIIHGQSQKSPLSFPELLWNMEVWERFNNSNEEIWGGLGATFYYFTVDGKLSLEKSLFLSSWSLLHYFNTVQISYWATISFGRLKEFCEIVLETIANEVTPTALQDRFTLSDFNFLKAFLLAV